LALTSPISGGRSVGIVRLRTQAMEFSFLYVHFVASPFLKLANSLSVGFVPVSFYHRKEEGSVNLITPRRLRRQFIIKLLFIRLIRDRQVGKLTEFAIAVKGKWRGRQGA
jgi:hypothetical protein